jgi:uncharacterized membrane protein
MIYAEGTPKKSTSELGLAWPRVLLAIFFCIAGVMHFVISYENEASAIWKAALWIRLPLQLVVAWWVWRATARPQR